MTFDEAVAALAADGVAVQVEEARVLRLRYGAFDGGYLTTCDLPLGDYARAVQWLIITAAQFHPDSTFLQNNPLGGGGA